MPTQYRLFRWDGENESSMKLEVESFDKKRIEHDRKRFEKNYPENHYRIVPKKFKRLD